MITKTDRKAERQRTLSDSLLQGTRLCGGSYSRTALYKRHAEKAERERRK